MKTQAIRKIVIPGEEIASGENYLPGEGTEKKEKKIIATRYGLMEEASGLVRVIPLSGVYTPRKGNIIIGRVENLVFNGWIIDILTSDNAFLSLMEVPRFVDKNNGDILFEKIFQGLSRV